MRNFEWRFYDPQADKLVSTRSRPHWDQNGVLTFVTFRLVDSMPQGVVEHWKREQAEWLEQNECQVPDLAEAAALGRLPEPMRRQFLKFRKQRWHESLDDCHGRCLLRLPEVAQEVADSLLSFNNQRYDLERFVVMPNHLHLLVQMRDERSARKQITEWMRFTGRKINKALNQSGDFWQTEPFDHLVRSDKQFRYLQTYIAENPKYARLNSSDCLLWVCDS
jgi:REP element-mobilizing transposase RayT